MDTTTKGFDASRHASYGSSAAPLVYYCSLCEKPYARGETSSNPSIYFLTKLTYEIEALRDRHMRYCGSRPRKRLRSCQACNAAKTKCSFEPSCLRCTKKGIECVYDELAKGGKMVSPRTSADTYSVTARSNDSLVNDSLHAKSGLASNEGFSSMTMDDNQFQFVSGNHRPQLDFSMQPPFFDENLTIEGLLAFEEPTPDQDQWASVVAMAPYNESDRQSGSWCDWMGQGVSLSVITENSASKRKANLLAIERPHAQHNVDLIIQSLRAVPSMMLRKETFPWFIHPHSEASSWPTGPVLPEPLLNCMSIAQLFASKTPETSLFLWRSIRAEYNRFVVDVRVLLSLCAPKLTS
jgi:hypothetical protein